MDGNGIENNGKWDINYIVLTIPQSIFKEDDMIIFKAKFVNIIEFKVDYILLPYDASINDRANISVIIKDINYHLN